MVQAQSVSMANRSRYAGCQQRGELLSDQRPAKKIALPLCAIARLQQGQLHLFFHPFGDHPLFEAGAHGDDDADDDAITQRQHTVLTFHSSGTRQKRHAPEFVR